MSLLDTFLQRVVNPKQLLVDAHNIATLPQRTFHNVAVSTSGAHILPVINPHVVAHQLPYQANLQLAQPATANGVPQLPQNNVQSPRVFYPPTTQPLAHLAPAPVIAPAPQPIRKVILQGTENPHWTIYSGPNGNKWYENDVTGLRLPFNGT